MRAGATPYLRSGLLEGDCLVVGAVVGQSVHSIHDGEQTRAQGNTRASYSPGITAASEFLMVGIDDLTCTLEEFNIAHKLIAKFGMTTHGHPFRVCQFTGLPENAVRHPEFSYVMEQSSVLDLNKSLPGNAHLSSDSGRQVGNTAGVTTRALIAKIEGQSQSLESGCV